MEEVNKEKNTPEKKFRASPIAVTVWANEVVNKDGEVSLYRTVSMERTYKDNDGLWKKTSYLRANDLPKAILVLSKAFEYISINEENIVVEDY